METAVAFRGVLEYGHANRKDLGSGGNGDKGYCDCFWEFTRVLRRKEIR